MCKFPLIMKSFKFVITGKVQKVYFRKFTQEEAIKLSIRGWVKNTTEGTVIGVAEGENHSISLFKEWLSTTGSPTSRIDSATFTEENEIVDYTFANFDIDRA